MFPEADLGWELDELPVDLCAAHVENARFPRDRKCVQKLLHPTDTESRGREKKFGPSASARSRALEVSRDGEPNDMGCVV